jgi:outer membrane protein assembly factor BamE (lipoprotein component of BamABCDE complex)
VRRTVRTTLLALPIVAAGLTGCVGIGEPVIRGTDTTPRLGSTITRGFVMPERGIEQVQPGASREQVQFVLGTPSTVATLDGDVFYYVGQVIRRQPFQQDEVVDQRVFAVYFDRQNRVSRLANWGIQDGRVFDFISRTTPSGGQEPTLLNQIFRNLISTNPFAPGGGGSGPAGAPR